MAGQGDDMTSKATGRDILENAYRLSTPADSIAFYREFATHYDRDFAQHLGYHFPKLVAGAYHRAAMDADVPVADVGCGTGLVAAELGLPPGSLEGMDISPEMLGIARGRNLYRDLHEVDLTAPLDRFRGVYGAVISAGTFTHGHLGPGPLRGLLDIARPGGLFVIGVNRVHFDREGFRDVLDAMTGENRITQVRIEEVNIYATTGHEHSGDLAMILQYRKL
jgi:predicted TPR repeat methyltransferase